MTLSRLDIDFISIKFGRKNKGINKLWKRNHMSSLILLIHQRIFKKKRPLNVRNTTFISLVNANNFVANIKCHALLNKLPNRYRLLNLLTSKSIIEWSASILYFCYVIRFAKNDWPICFVIQYFHTNRNIINSQSFFFWKKNIGCNTMLPLQFYKSNLIRLRTKFFKLNIRLANFWR